MSKQKYIVIDVAWCHDCNNCFMACKDEHVGNNWAPYTEEQPRHGHRWMNIQAKERGQYPRIDVAYLPTPCQHCENAPCQKACPDAVVRREDGIVLLDLAKAKGNRALVDSCPYGAINYNEALDVAQKCTMCAHILDGGEAPAMPRCVHSCPTEAMKFYEVEPEEMAKIVAEEGLSVYRPELGTNPHVYYKNLHRFEKFFVSGEVVQDDECLEGASVTLKGENVYKSAVTDCFGEFKFDALEAGEYAIEINGVKKLSVSITTSTNVGEIFL